MAPSPFVVLSQGRSGTTWLLSMLNSHPDVHCSGEILLKAGSNKEKWSHLENALEHMRNSKESAVGFKVMLGQRPYDDIARCDVDIENCTSYTPSQKSYAQFCAWLERKAVKVVALERQGLGHYTSRLQHKQDRQMHRGIADYKCESAECVVSASSTAAKVTIPTPTLLSVLRSSVVTWKTVLHSLRTANNSVLHLTYAVLLRDPVHHMQEIYSFLGVNATYTPITNGTLKMHTSLSNSITNIGEVEKTLNGTSWLQELYST